MWNAQFDENDLGLQVLRAYIVMEELRALLALRDPPRPRADLAPAVEVLLPRHGPRHPRDPPFAEIIDSWWPRVGPSVHACCRSRSTLTGSAQNCAHHSMPAEPKANNQPVASLSQTPPPWWSW
jgi:hypothetical protein